MRKPLPKFYKPQGLQTLLQVKEESTTQRRTHVQIWSHKDFTNYSIGYCTFEGFFFGDTTFSIETGLSNINTIKHEAKEIRTSRKQLEAYHQLGIEQAKEFYKDYL